jgi:hypothetical protein
MGEFNDRAVPNTAVDDALALQADMQAEQALLQSGTPARATITNCTNTGLLVNFNPQVVLDLSVALGGQPPYEIQLTTNVPATYLSRLHAGSDVSVRVDPSKPQRVVIDWSTG